MGLGKFLARERRLVYGIILRGTVKILAENSEEKTKEYAILKQLNNNSHNDLILAHDDTVCFQIFE